MKRVLALGLAALVAGACSVTTPRHGGEAALVASSGGATADGSGSGGSSAGSGAADGGASSGSGGSAAGSTGHGSQTATQPASATRGPSSSASGGTAAGAGAAKSSSPAPGVTKDTITVSVIAGFSGPLAAVVAKAYDGLLTWQDDVNAAGGIYGRKVQLAKVDHQDTPDGGVAACKAALSNGSFFAIVPEGVEATLSAVGCLDAAGMPTFYYSATVDPKWKVAFADIIPSDQAGTEGAGYVRSALGGATKKVGVIYVNQASYQAFADTFMAASKKLGVSMAPPEKVEPNQASFTSNLARLQAAGVQILIISATTDAIGIIRDAKGMGWNPTFTGWGFQFDFVTEAGRNLFDGVAGLRAYAPVDAPAFGPYAARMQADGRGRSRDQDLEGFPTYGHALVVGELLKRAGPSPTWASLVAGAETFNGWDNGILGPITWSRTDHVGTHVTFPAACCNSDWTWKTAAPPRTSY